MSDDAILFEYPLNEKMRSWLRMEALLQQLEQPLDYHDDRSLLSFFRAITDLLEIFERGDMRADLLRELENQLKKMEQWSKYPETDNLLVNTLCQQLRQQIEHLNSAPRFGNLLKESLLISQIRQRLTIPGGYCNFDLPNLHLWRYLPENQRDRDVANWITSLAPLTSSLKSVLDFTRQAKQFQSEISVNGFFQSHSNDAGLLRLRLPLKCKVYPQISGHKNRFAIRFLSFDGDQQAVPDPLYFEIAYC